MFRSRPKIVYTFSYSRRTPPRRPLVQRLTPLAWASLLAGGFLVASCLFFLAHRLGPSLPTIDWAAMPQPAIPTSTDNRMAVPTAVAPQPPRLKSTVASAAKTPTTATTNTGNTTALPTAQTAQIETTVKQYYSLITGMSLPMYLAQRDLLWPTFFAGEALQAIQKAQAEQTTYDALLEGDVVVTVEEISTDGRAATVRVVRKSWLTDTIDIVTQSTQATRVQQPDTTLTLRMEFVALESRWKIVQINTMN
jgi:hypothetical protein